MPDRRFTYISLFGLTALVLVFWTGPNNLPYSPTPSASYPHQLHESQSQADAYDPAGSDVGLEGLDISRARKRKLSGWFSDAGYLRLDLSAETGGLGSVYELREEAARGFGCDEERFLAVRAGSRGAGELRGEEGEEARERRGTRLCLNTIKLWRELRDHSVTHKAALRQEQEGRGGLTAREVSEARERHLAIDSTRRQDAHHRRGIAHPHHVHVHERDRQLDLSDTFRDISELRGKRVLYLGDSIDRFAIDELAEALPTSLNLIVDPTNPSKEVDHAYHHDHTTRVFAMPITDSVDGAETDAHSWAGSRTIRTALGLEGGSDDDSDHAKAILESLFRIDFLFMFGISTLPAYEAHPDDFIARLELLQGPLFGTDKQYDLIVLDAGLWDLEKFDRSQPPLEPDGGLPADIIEDYVDRYIEVVQWLRSRFTPSSSSSSSPSPALAIRLLHDLKHDLDLPKFRPLRAHQVRQAQLEIARREDLLVLPFGQHMRAQPWYYKGDGFHPERAADMVHMEMVLRAAAEGGAGARAQGAG